MKLKKKKRIGFKTCLVLGLVVVLLDWLVQGYFRNLGIGVANLGISFGLGSEIAWFWKVLPAGIFLALLGYEFVFKTRPSVYLICLGLGGLGNLVPRLVFGNVWDYISLPFWGLWINLSDILISISVLSYILSADETRSSL